MTRRATTRADRPPGAVPPVAARRIRRALLRWYDENRRDLPWRRRSGDPYAQWVAEIMLQQTRVETVLKYYEPFLRRFSSVKALAAAREDDVLKAWEGLGYYRRILNLHRATKQLIRKRLDVPRSARELAELPGVGEYTAAAISSIAFDEAVAAVDGNVARVIARLLRVEIDVTSSRGRRTIQAAADQLLAQDRPGDFNQAWMDLGSSICAPRSPKCPACPLRHDCAAYRDRVQDQLPLRGGRNGKSTPVIRVTCCVVCRRQHLLMRQRPTKGLWAGLWEFPEIDGKPTSNGRMTNHPSILLEPGCVPLRGPSRHTGLVEHQLSHRRYVFDMWLVEAPRTWKSPTGFQWISLHDTDSLAISTAHRKVLAACFPHRPNARARGAF